MTSRGLNKDLHQALKCCHLFNEVMKDLVGWCLTLVALIGVEGVSASQHRYYQESQLMTSSEITRCGSYLNNSHGYIKTPNFPREFPLPISCQWLLHAPPGKKIMLYFTQYYMRQSLHLIEYDYYESVHKNRGRHDLGEVSFEVSSYTVYKPYLLLRFEVEEAGNIHLRVHQFLLDVYGFNITYEMVDDNDDLRPDDCFKHKCSFLGNCLASHDFDEYQCHCFSGYFGEECQYGPFCNPDKGINMCKNGGKCRYFYGSLVNTCECPPAYEGVQCETKKEGYNISDSHCDKLGCEQRCVESDGSFHCECEEGFRLATDLKSCKEKGRMRYFAQVRFAAQQAGTVIDDQELCQQFRKEFLSKVEDVMEFVGVRFIETVSIANIRQKDGYWYVDFVFMGDKSENRNIWFLVDILVANTTICGSYVADKTYVMRDAKPALHSMSLKSYDNKPVKVDDILTLVCEAKGSSNLQFEWFKDGSPVNVSTTQRNMYIMTIPKANPEIRTSVLDIDKANKLDAGVFTCKATDWNETKERNLTIEILKPPHVQVEPLSKAIEPAGVAVFVCLSREDKRGTFQYTWYRGDRKILPGSGDNDELAEDLLPAGSRLTIRNARKTLTYNCVVESESGRAQDNVTVMVVEGLKNKQNCEEEVFNGIIWPQNPCGSSSIQKCTQKEYAKAIRQCECNEDDAKWAIADMTECISPQLEFIRDEVDSLQLGYVSSTTGRLLAELEKFHRTQDTAKPMMGDLQLSCHLLTRLQDHARKHHSIEIQPAALEEILKLASILLERIKLGSYIEKRGDVGTCVLHMMELLRKDRRMQENITATSPNKHITTKMLDIGVQYNGSKEITILSNDLVSIKVAATVPSVSDNKRKQRSMKPVIHRSFNSTMLAVTCKDAVEFISTEDLSAHQMELNSAAVMSGPVWNNAQHDLENDLHAPPVIITFHHLHALARVAENSSYCLRWHSEGSPAGIWTDDGCQVIVVQENLTKCRCQTPGHFVVARSTCLDIGVIGTHAPPFDVSVIGSVICLLCCLATLLIRLAVWSQSQPVIRVIVVSLCCAFIMLNVIIIIGFHSSSHKLLCRCVLLLLVFSYIATFSFLLMEAIYLILKYVKKVPNLNVAILTIVGWGPPVLALGVFIILTYVVDSDETNVAFCWLLEGRWDFNAFISIASIYFLVYCGMLLYLVKDACQRDNKESASVHRKYLFYIIRSAITVLLLTFSCIVGITMVNTDVSAYRYLFSSIMAVLGIVLLVLHGVVYIKKCSAVISECQKECLEAISMRDQVTRQNSGASESIKTISNCGSTMSAKLPFGGFMISADEDPNDPYVRDRKYTKERKEHLKSLLGTGSTDDYCRKGSNSGSRSNSITRSTIVTIGTGDDEEASESSASSTKARHVSNPKCACTKCGTALPYKPARGRAYILDQPLNDAPDEPLLADKASAPHSKEKTADTKATKTAEADASTKSSSLFLKKDHEKKSANQDVTYSPVKKC